MYIVRRPLEQGILPTRLRIAFWSFRLVTLVVVQQHPALLVLALDPLEPNRSRPGPFAQPLDPPH